MWKKIKRKETDKKGDSPSQLITSSSDIERGEGGALSTTSEPLPQPQSQAQDQQTNKFQSDKYWLEFLDSEFEYVQHLKVVVKVYLDPLAKAPESIISKQNIKLIFNSVDLLYEFHSTQFLPALKVSLQNDTQPSLCKAFEELVHQVSPIYIKYINSIKESIVALCDCIRKTAKLASLIEKTRGKEGSSDDLVDLLTFPVKRFRKYPSAVQELLKECNQESDLYATLQSVLHKLNHSIQETHALQVEKEIEEMLLMIHLQPQLLQDAKPAESPLILIQLGRRFIKQGALVMVDSKEKHPVICFLFSDMLMYTKIQESTERSRRSSVSVSSLSGFRKQSTTKELCFYKVLGRVHLKNSLVVDTNTSEGQFQIVIPGEQVYTFEAPSYEKQSWIKDLQEAMYKVADTKGTKAEFVSKKMQDREWQLVTANSEEVVFSRDDVILSEGNAHNLYVYKITEGAARVEVVLATGKLVTINKLKEGTLFGEASMLGVTETTARVVAETDIIKLKKIEASFLAGLLKMDITLATKFWRTIASTLHFRLRTLPSAYKLAGDVKNEGITRFNDGTPSKAIKYLIDEGFLKNTPDSIVKFLKETPELDKTKVGEFLGERSNVDVLSTYVHSFNFTNMQLDIALRLPGEAQVIDRIMEQLSVKYFADSPSGFMDKAFAIIMLATDLWNPSIKVKMTKQEWIKNNRGNNLGQDYDRQFLEDVYSRIAAERLKLNDEETNDSALETTPVEPQKLDRILSKKFNLTDEDLMVIKDYKCIYGKRAGHMYVSQKYICFYSKVFGITDKIVLSLAHIIAIENRQNDITFVENKKRTINMQFSYQSKEEQEEAYNLISNLWTNYNKLHNDGSKSKIPPSPALSHRPESPPKNDNINNKLVDPLTTEDWMLILNCAKEHTYTKDSVIIAEGDAFQRLYQIINGTVRIERSVIPQTQEPTSPEVEVKSRPKAEKERMRRFFDKFDKNGNGINPQEFRALASHLGEDLSEAATKDVFDRININQDGLLTFEDFYQWWGNSSNPSNTASSDGDLIQRLKLKYFKQFIYNTFGSLKNTRPATVLARAGPGEIFGEISFIEPVGTGGASASVVADSEVQLYVVEGHILARLFEWKPQLAARFFLYISTITEKRLRQSEALLISGDNASSTNKKLSLRSAKSLEMEQRKIRIVANTESAVDHVSDNGTSTPASVSVATEADAETPQFATQNNSEYIAKSFNVPLTTRTQHEQHDKLGITNAILITSSSSPSILQMNTASAQQQEGTRE